MRNIVFPQLLELIPPFRQRLSPGIEGLIGWCHAFVGRRHRLSAADHDDIVQGAMLETLKKEESHPECSDEELALALLRALAKLKKRGQRDRLRILADGTTAYELKSAGEQESDLIAKQLYSEVCDILFQVLAVETPRLSDKVHDLVIRQYGLQKFFRPRKPVQEFPSFGAARKASWRARKTLANLLAENLRKRMAGLRPEEDSLVLQLCLDIITEKDFGTLADLCARESSELEDTVG